MLDIVNEIKSQLQNLHKHKLEDMAKKTGISTATLCRIRSGQTDIRLSYIEQLIKAGIIHSTANVALSLNDVDCIDDALERKHSIIKEFRGVKSILELKRETNLPDDLAQTIKTSLKINALRERLL